MAAEELHAFEKERRSALVLLAVATVGGLFVPVVAMLFFLAISVLLIVEPLWRARWRQRRGAAS